MDASSYSSDFITSRINQILSNGSATSISTYTSQSTTDYFSNNQTGISFGNKILIGDQDIVVTGSVNKYSIEDFSNLQTTATKNGINLDHIFH